MKPCIKLRLPVYCLILFSWIIILPSSVSSADPNLKSIECLICGKVHQNLKNRVEYKKKHLFLCSGGCEAAFRKASIDGKLDPITAKIEPRTALFQEDSNPKPEVGKWAYWISCYLLAGLVFGGISAYTSLQKGQNAWAGFLLGFFLNIVGGLIALLVPKRETRFQSEGLTKIPTTRSEKPCQSCGHANHPSAKRCHGCGQNLSPAIPSEVELISLQKKA